MFIRLQKSEKISESTTDKQTRLSYLYIFNVFSPSIFRFKQLYLTILYCKMVIFASTIDLYVFFNEKTLYRNLWLPDECGRQRSSSLCHENGGL